MRKEKPASQDASVLSGSELLVHVREEQARAWRGGERPPVEDFLGRFPRLAADADAVLDLVYAEVVLREEQGEVVGVEDYQRRFPDHAAALTRQFAVHRALTSPETALTQTHAGSPPRPGPPPAVPGYEILEELGRGGMGVVYKARHIRLNRLVALKIILDGRFAGPEERVRFLGEAEAAAGLHHPHIIPVLEFGEHQGLLFCTLEFVPGGSLAGRLGGVPRPPREAAALIERLARAMQYAHGKGIVHRDLKPANVLLAEDGTPKVTDFGLAKRVEVGSGLTATGAVMGTPSYMAPEQAGGGSKHAGPHTDIYSLGAILYECLTGRPPFKAATPVETMMQVLDQEAVSARQLQPQVPDDLATICHKCLQKEPARRYASARELAEDCAAFLEGKPIRARPVGPAERAWRWCRRNPVVAGLTGAVLLALVLGVIVSSLLAVKAGLAAAAAEAAEQKARREAAEAELARDRAEVLAYSSQISLALRTWEDGWPEQGRLTLAATQPDLRRWEYRYLRRFLGGDERILSGHMALVLSVAFSPDGALVASASHDSTVRVWKADTGEMVCEFRGHTGPVEAAAFHPESDLVASASTDATVEVWEARTGRVIRTLRGHKSGLMGVAWDAAGKRLVSGGGGKEGRPGEVRVWDAASGQLIRSVEGLSEQVLSVDIRPDGRQVAAGLASGLIHLWDAETGELQRTLRGHTNVARQVRYSPDGKSLASASYDRTVRIWDPVTGAEVTTHSVPNLAQAVAYSRDGRRLAAGVGDFAVDGFGLVKVWDVGGTEVLNLRGHQGGVNAVAFRPDGQRLASGSSDRTVRLWDIRQGQEARSFEVESDLGALAMSPAGSWCVTGTAGGAVEIRDTTTGEVVRELDCHRAPLCAAAFDQDGRRLATASVDGVVRVWDPETGRRLLDLGNADGPGAAVAFSPLGGRLAAGSSAGTVRLWSLPEGRALPGLRGHRQPITAVAFSPDGRRLLSAAGRWGEDGEVRLRDAETGELIFTLAVTGIPRAAAFDPTGTWIALGTSDGRLGLWDAVTGEPGPRPAGHEGGVSAIVFSPDGRQLFSGGADRVVRVWDVRTGQATLALKGHAAGVVALALDRAGTRLMSGGADQSVRVWDAGGADPEERPPQPDRPGGPPALLLEHRVLVWGVGFSPNGRRLATASGDGVVRVWDRDEGRVLLHLDEHTARAFGVGWSPDGKVLASGSEDGTVRFWDGRTGEPLRTIAIEPGAWVWDVKFSPDGQVVAVASSNKLVRLYDAASGALKQTCKGHNNKVSKVAFSPDGRRLVSASADRTAIVWDVASGTAALTLTGHSAGVTAVAYRADGLQIATTGEDGMVMIWDAKTGEKVREYRGHKAPAQGVGFSPDGSRIVSAAQGGEIRIWHAADESSQSWRGHGLHVWSLSVSPDGREFATASWDNSVKVWPLSW